MVKGLRRIAAEGGGVASARLLVDGMLDELRTLRSEAQRSSLSERRRIQNAQARAEFAACRPAPDRAWVDSDALVWYKRWLDISIAEYVLKDGAAPAMPMLVREAQLGDFVDEEVHRKSQAVVERLLARDCGPALEWCAENASRLRRLDSSLVFQLRLQQFIELVRLRQQPDALSFARERLGVFAGEPNYAHDYQIAMATLAMPEPEESGVPEYAALFSPQRWQGLADQFQQDLRRAYGMHANGMLEVNVKAGLCALKTRACGSQAPGNGRSAQCPMCTPLGEALGKQLPYPLRPRSSLICPVTQQLMNEDNPPMMLPGGQVCSMRALRMLLERELGEFTGEGAADSGAAPRHSLLRLCDARQVYII